MVSFLHAALVFTLAFGGAQSTGSPGALDTEIATRLVNGWPGLSPSTGRRLVSLKAGGEGASGMGFIEFRFTDGEATRTAVGFAAPVSAMANNKNKVISEHRGWVLARVLEDKTLDDVIEGLRAARTSANEAAAMGRLRSVVSGQIAYATANDGFFSTPACLAEDAKCLPPGPGRGMAFLAPADAALGERSGYRYRFSPGAAAKAEAGRKISSPSFVTFAVTAVPIAPGETGDLGFCADDSGNICAAFDGSEPAIAGGRCAYPCPAVAAAIKGLKASTSSKRGAAARALSRMANQAGEEALASALPVEPDAGVRQALVDALGSTGSAASRAALLQALKDSDGEVRLAAGSALSGLSPAPDRAEGERIVAVVRPFLDHAEPMARMRAVDVIGRLGQASAARSALLQALKDTDVEVRLAAGSALSLSPAPDRADRAQVVAVVKPLLDHSDAMTRVGAVSLLGRLGLASDRAAIKARLNDADEYVRRTAEDALKELDERTARERPRPKRN